MSEYPRATVRIFRGPLPGVVMLFAQVDVLTLVAPLPFAALFAFGDGVTPKPDRVVCH